MMASPQSVSRSRRVAPVTNQHHHGPSLTTSKRKADSATALLENDTIIPAHLRWPGPKPSDVLNERSLTTSDRLAQASAQASRMYAMLEGVTGDLPIAPMASSFSVPPGVPLFHVSPPEIILQNVTPFNTYEVAIHFRNDDKYPRRLRLEPIDDPHFELKGWKSEALYTPRVAPGMDVPFLLRFTPDEEKDISTHILCETERERFLVPIRVIGPRAVFDFPDELSFGEVPVMHATSRSILVRNVGNKDGAFHLHVPEGAPWEFEPASAFVKRGASTMVAVHFRPNRVSEYTSFAHALFNSQATSDDEFSAVGGGIVAPAPIFTPEDEQVDLHSCFIRLMGSADNVDVRLDRTSLTLDATYISQTSCKTVLLQNNSDIVANFAWKRCSTATSESQYRDRTKKLMQLRSADPWPLDDFASSHSHGLDAFIDGPASSATNFVVKSQHRDIDQDPLLFVDPVFVVEPLTGTIWPHSSAEITITFRPATAGSHQESMFCEISGRETRLPLLMSGSAIGPKLRFSYDLLDVETVFIDSTHVYTVLLENTGLIDAPFEFNKEAATLHGQYFEFTPASGTVAVGQSIRVHITFQPQALGDFHEAFLFNVTGAPAPLQLQACGTVVGPTFDFDVLQLDFGTVSYGFPSRRVFHIVNTCEIPMEYNLRLVRPPSSSCHEVLLFPVSEVIPARGCIVVSAEFVGRAMDVFEAEIHVDVARVGSSIRVLPMRAYTAAPCLDLSEDAIDFGAVYLGVPATKVLRLTNDSLLDCRYSLMPPDLNPALGSLVIEPMEAEVLAGTCREVMLTFTPHVLIPWASGAKFAIAGREGDGERVIGLSCMGKGPDISLSAMVVSWGKVPVLVQQSRTLELLNSCIIDGHFKCSWRNPAANVFTVSPMEGTVPANSKLELTVGACLDDSIAFKNWLEIEITSGPTFLVEVSARGVGSTVVFQPELQTIDFGPVFSNSTCSREFTLTNKGRRTHFLVWMLNDSLYGSKNSSATQGNTTFKITPHRFTLKPNTSQVITVTGTSAKALVALERLLCQETIDGDPNRRELLQSSLRAEFIDPLLVFDPPIMDMDLVHTSEAVPQDMVRPVRVTNNTLLRINATLKCTAPWQLPTSQLSLAGGESKQIELVLHASQFADRISRTTKSKLTVQYAEHPQKNSWDLVARAVFPNLELSSTVVDMGCIPVKTCAVKQVTLRNPGTVKTKYAWKLLESTCPFVDVCPLYGALEPGEEVLVNVTMHGATDGSHMALLGLDAEGGPLYELKLHCLVAETHCELAPNNLSLSLSSHLQLVDADAFLINRGRYPARYRVIFTSDSPIFNSVMILNSQGTLPGRAREKLKIKVLPLVPGIQTGFIFVQFDDQRPIKVHIKIDATQLDLECQGKVLWRREPRALVDRIALPTMQAQRGVTSVGSHFISVLVKELQQQQSKRGGGAASRQAAAQLNVLQQLANQSTRCQLVDWGEVIINQVFSRNVSLYNPLNVPVTFTLDSQALIDSHFHFPAMDKIGKIFKLGPKESVSVPLTLDTHNTTIDMCCNVALPVRIQGGPSFDIMLRACISDPQLTLTPSELQFNTVLCSTRVTQYATFTNSKGVPCMWSLAPKKKTKDSAVWLMVPDRGELQPGESVKVAVHFTPTMTKLYKHSFTINMEGSSAPMLFNVQGSGKVMQLAFDPAVATFTSIQPFSDGADIKVTIRNPNPIPIEVFSVDFDEQFRNEASLLTDVAAMHPGEVFYIPITNPGEPLKLASLAQPTVTVSDDAPAIPMYVSSSQPLLVQPAPQPANVSVPSSAVAVAADDHPASVSGERMCTVSIVLHGAPFSGRSDLANQLNKIGNVVVVSLDSMIDNFLLSQSEPNTALVAKIKDLAVLHKVPLPPGIARPQPVAGHHGGTEAGGSAGSGGTGAAAAAAELDELELTDQDIECIVRSYFAQEAIPTSACIVFDGLETRYSKSHSVHLRGIVAVLLDSRRSNIYFVHTKAEPAAVFAREVDHVQRDYEEQVANLPKIPTIADDEYERLSPYEREAFDQTLARVRRVRKDFFRNKERERKQYETEVLNRIGEKKNEDEKLRRKDKKRKAAAAGPQASTLPAQQASSPSQGTLAPLATSTNASTSAAPLPSPHPPSTPSGGPVPAGAASTSADKALGSMSSRDFKTIGTTAGLLAEASPELLLREATYRMYETYVANVDAVLQAAKDLERHAMKIAAPAAAATDKKKKQAGGIGIGGGGAGGAGASTLSNNSGAQAQAAQVSSSGLQGTPAAAPSSADSDSAMHADFHLVGDDVSKVTIIEFDSQDGANAFAKGLEPILAPEPSRVESILQEDVVIVDQVVDPQFWLSHYPPEVKEPVKEQTTSKKGKKTQEEQKEESDEPKKQVYRWVMQPNDAKVVNIKFNTADVGKYTMHLRFGITGALTQVFSVMCHGTCQHPNIVTDPRKIFSRVRKTVEGDLSGHFVIATNRYEFGPLPLTRQRGDKDRYVENKLTLTLVNPFHQEVKLSIALLSDKSDIFLLDSTSLDIKPFATVTYNLYCWPKVVGRVEDSLVICIKDNPEPVVFKLSSTGYKPEIEVDRKAISFDKLLIGKPDVREFRVRNPCCVPLNLRLIGADMLGEEVTITPNEALVQPQQEQVFTVEFKSSRPVVFKKNIKLEFGSTDTLDFGTVRVLEESKSFISFKNRGRYEVSFRVMCERDEFSQYFTVSPNTGAVAPSDKPLQISVVFASRQPVVFRDQLALRCLALDSTTNQVMYTIPIKVNARSVLSRYNLLPARDLNFGALVHGSKSTRSFVIENTGEFEFRFTIVKLAERASLATATSDRPFTQRGVLKKKMTSAGGRMSPLGSVQKLSVGTPVAVAPPPKPSAVNKKDGGKPSELSGVFGPFIVTPINGTIAPGSKSTIMVDFMPDHPDMFDEIVGIDISDRTVDEVPEPIEYHFVGESCLPGINTMDISSIFEEQAICKRLDNLMLEKVYAEDERTLYFGTLIAGQESVTRIKLSNPFKVPAEVSVGIKSRSKAKEEIPFAVEPASLTIASHESRFVTVRFRPTAIQPYFATFEAVIDNSTLDLPARTYAFDLRGEGALPRVTVDRTVIRFKRSLPNQSTSQVLVLRNDGILPAKAYLEWAVPDSQISSATIGKYLDLMSMQTMSIPLTYNPTRVGRVEAELRMRIADNSFESATIHLLGDCYQEDLLFDGLDDVSNGDESGKLSSTSAHFQYQIQLGDCFIGQRVSRIVQVTNRSESWMRVAWNCGNQDILVTPSAFFLAPRTEKAVTVSFEPAAPTTLKGQVITCTYGFITRPSKDWTAGDGVEPSVEFTEKMSERSIQVHAVADWSSYSCTCQSIHFKKTMMYQSRVYRFQVHNTSTVRLNYAFVDLDADFLVVEPARGEVPPNDFVTISVKFTPLDEGLYEETLCLAFSNVSPQSKLPSQHLIEVTGSSLRPFCHFDLPDMDHVHAASGGGGAAMERPVDAGTRYLEFTSAGVRTRNVKRFYILNPTHLDWRFEWLPASPSEPSPFTCLTPSGLVLHHKRSEIAFDYSPETTGTVESTWFFSIPQHNIRVPFLLIGRAIEPNVFLDKSTINFKPVLIGKKSKEIVRIFNTEDTAFSFQFQTTSTSKRGQAAAGGGGDDWRAIEFSPASGVIEPRSEMAIELTFQPRSERAYSTQLTCIVKRKTIPLNVNLRGDGYRVSASLTSELVDGSMIHFVARSLSSSSTKPTHVKDATAVAKSTSSTSAGIGPTMPLNTIELGRVQVGERRTKTFHLHNLGRYLFDFSWQVGGEKDKACTVTPMIGTVSPGDKVEVTLAFCSTTPLRLPGIPIVCNVTNGPSYPLHLYAEAVFPQIVASPSSIDFGSNFVWKSGSAQQSPQARMITFKNNDLMSLSIDLTSSNPSVFQIPDTTIKTLAPRESVQVPVSFVPRETTAYKEYLLVEINSVSKLKVPLSGTGCEFRVQLMRPEYRHVTFGSLRPGQSVGRTIRVINRSPVGADLCIGPQGTTESLGKYGITVRPMVFSLESKQVQQLELHFEPPHRVTPFIEELFMESNGQVVPLCIVSGAALGVDVRLETDTVPFGPVAVGSSTTKRLTMSNLGDLGVAYKWDRNALKPDFTIVPSEGYLAPGMDAAFEITFQPVAVNPDIRKEGVECRIEGVPEPMEINLSGICIPPPSHNDIIKFSTPVRTAETRSIVLSNKTSTRWVIRPVIDHASWKGAEVVMVEPGSNTAYEITFLPMEMAAEYAGTVFFPLADGSGLLYKLVGAADKPQPVATITRDVTGKKNHVESMTVTNWLKRPQRFRVTLEQVGKTEPFVLLKGHDFVDLPGLGSREYKLHFYSFKETTANVRVTFKNEQTGEYMYYLVTFKVPATFTAHCSIPDMNLPTNFALAPGGESEYTFEYLPLVPKDPTVGKLVLTSPELGTFVYDLTVTAVGANPEKTTHFKATLGNQHTQTIRFVHYCKSKTDCDKSIIAQPAPNQPSTAAPPTTAPASPAAIGGGNGISGGSSSALYPGPSLGSGAEVQFDVTYEPSKLGDAHALLTVSSASGGDYTFPLHGLCAAPRPQGPITIRTGANTAIAFKNVFNAPATFALAVDNACFSVKASETIGAKKTVSINVGYRAPGEKEGGGFANASMGAGGSSGDGASGGGAGTGGGGGGKGAGAPGGTSGKASGANPSSEGKKGGADKSGSDKSSSSSGGGSGAGSSGSGGGSGGGGAGNKDVVGAGASKVGKLTISHAATGVSWVFYLKGMAAS
ncbi:hypothetical protein BCR44DRAFT_1513959 [Catenaria anguillulae PL171]|uniref:MSP domain-containing protein n=1 Tax=Catenaria anguillulae PL171 TaxID=765915 RepID=A0A1Y2HIG6_9FUNG|nr:hypothetical protein BCR44DRAFT_1513959 [Catenaria anguillulae PL171]